MEKARQRSQKVLVPSLHWSFIGKELRVDKAKSFQDGEMPHVHSHPSICNTRLRLSCLFVRDDDVRFSRPSLPLPCFNIAARCLFFYSLSTGAAIFPQCPFQRLYNRNNERQPKPPVAASISFPQVFYSQ